MSVPLHPSRRQQLARVARLCLGAACWLAFTLSTGPAFAESGSDIDAARAAYVQGLDAAKNEQWSDAVEAFRHSYELSTTSAALYNLGFALRALGRHREARDTFGALLKERAALDGSTLAQAERMRSEEAKRVVSVNVAGFDPEGAYEVLLDGVPTALSGQRELALEVDEGKHALAVHRGSRTVLRWTGSVQAGAQVSLEIDSTPQESAPDHAVALSPPLPVIASSERDPKSPHSNRKWWWIGGGAAVVVGAVAGVLVYALKPAAPRKVAIDDGVHVVDVQ
jgi:hypothetical protein